MKLTNQLVKTRAGAQAGRQPGRPGRPRSGRPPVRRRPARRAADPSRDRLFAAAAREFAARGFAGTSVDRIAAAARLNKAMIYYHFHSKAALYREVLRDMFQAVEARVRIAAESTAASQDKVKLFIEAIAAEAEARPHFPAIWFREIAEGGTHLDATIIRDLAAIVHTLGTIVGDGVRRAEFKPIHPLLVHAGIIGPLLLFFASASLRGRIERAGVAGAGRIDSTEIVAHVQRITLGVLEGRM